MTGLESWNVSRSDVWTIVGFSHKVHLPFVLTEDGGPMDKMEYVEKDLKGL